VRVLRKNLQPFYYATYVKSTETTDDDGNHTGQYVNEYSKPAKMYANISAARGSADVEVFGVSLAYDKAIVTDDMGCPISETSILWIDTMPVLDNDGNTATPHDYVVKRVAKSLNSIAYAVSKVEVMTVPQVESELEEPGTEQPDDEDAEE